MKKALSIVFLTILTNTLFAQTEFQPGWFIVQRGAEYSNTLPGFEDFNGKAKISGLELEALQTHIGEPVLAFYKKDDYFSCFGPMGRRLVFRKGLKPAPNSSISRLGIMLDDIEILDGHNLRQDSYVLIIGQDIAKNTYKIIVEDDKQIDIPTDKIQLISSHIKELNQGFQSRYLIAN